MRCEYCGRVIQPGQTECEGCGAPVEHPIPMKDQIEKNDTLDYASFTRRMIAFIIDLVILAVLPLVGMNFLGAIIYNVICETYLKGATIGKKLMKIKVVDNRGEPVQLYTSIIRGIFKFILFGIGWITIPLSGEKKTLYDYVAGTKVIVIK